MFGHWHEQVPSEAEENLHFRKWILEKAAKSLAYQQCLMKMCRDDFLFYINCFVWQTNPNKPGTEDGPFITYKFQEDGARQILDWWINENQDCGIEKSRDLGASWFAMILVDYLSKFRRSQSTIVISHTEDAVDALGNPNSLFEKINFINQFQPDWMTQGIKRKALAWNYPTTGSNVIGQSSTVRSGVGGRGRIVLDEFSKQNNASAIWSQTRDTGRRLVIGTHYGPGGMFYDLMTDPSFRKVIWHWSHHPDKARGLYKWDNEKQCPIILDKSHEFPNDYEFVKNGTPLGGPFPGIRSFWYDQECKSRANGNRPDNGKRDIAMHLDIDPVGASAQFFDRDLIQGLIAQSRDPFWVGDIHFDPETGNFLSFVEGQVGALRLWVHLNTDGLPPEARYGIGWDLSTGVGATPSCASIVNLDTGVKVGEFASAHIKPDRLAYLAIALCKAFRAASGEPAKMVWEVNGPGVSFGKEVMSTNFRNIYYRMSASAVQGDKSAHRTTIPGWAPTQTTKPALLADYRAVLASGRYTNYSRKALAECLKFEFTANGRVTHASERNEEDPTGAKENHADQAIADALPCLLMQLAVQTVQPKKDVTVIHPYSPAARRQMAERRAREESLW